MKLEYGQKYIRRDGSQTGPLEPNQSEHPSEKVYPFVNPGFRVSYTPEGRYLTTREAPDDLVAEYYEKNPDLPDPPDWKEAMRNPPRGLEYVIGAILIITLTGFTILITLRAIPYSWHEANVYVVKVYTPQGELFSERVLTINGKLKAFHDSYGGKLSQDVGIKHRRIDNIPPGWLYVIEKNNSDTHS